MCSHFFYVVTVIIKRHFIVYKYIFSTFSFLSDVNIHFNFYSNTLGITSFLFSSFKRIDSKRCIECNERERMRKEITHSTSAQFNRAQFCLFGYYCCCCFCYVLAVISEIPIVIDDIGLKRLHTRERECIGWEWITNFFHPLRSF